MKILYDFQIFELQKYGGISRYFIELANSYNNDSDIKVISSAKISNNEYLLNNKISDNWVIPLKYIIKKQHYIQSKVNRLYTRYKTDNNSIDIFHPTYYDPYFLEYIGNIPFVLTIHDMIHEKFSDMFSPKDLTSFNKKLLAERASKIIAVSESTKQDIIDILQVESSKIEVIHHGSSMTPLSNTTILGDVPSKYILFVGNRTIYKNFNRFIKAISPLIYADNDLNVVCAGGGKFNEDEKRILDKLDIDKKVFQYNINDNTLAQLYKQAIVFVFPSMYEGFGIPILEAFACRCPVVCSNTSSLPEVADDAAIYFDPYDEESIFEAVLRMLNDSELRKNKINLGLQRLESFSWEQAAINTKKVYQKILNG